MARARTAIIGGGAALALAIVGKGFVETDAGRTAVDIVEAATLIVGDAKAPVLSRISKSGATGTLVCKVGVIANHPTKTYCTDGGSAGFLLSETEAADLLGEAEDAAPDVVADEIEIAADGRGGLVAGVRGIKE